MIEPSFSQKEEEILKKHLNTGFAKAAKDLSNLNKLPIEFSPSEITFSNKPGFKTNMEAQLNMFSKLDVIEQSFWGNISGTGFILLNSQKSIDVSLAMEKKSRIHSTEGEVNKTVLHIINSITSTCMSNLAETLKDQIDFSPPGIFIRGVKCFIKDFCNKDSPYIITSSSFTLSNEKARGLLFLAWEIESLEWIKSSLRNFK
jgi:chemotaxis protein CheY-P-specific phosphatase CheC